MEEAALYLMLDLFGDREILPKGLAKYLEGFHTKKTITVEETIKEEVVITSYSIHYTKLYDGASWLLLPPIATNTLRM